MTRSVTIPSTHKELLYTYWLQPKEAPVVYIIPGLGSHRLSDTVLALAELVYRDGFTAVCVSSAYNYEFMEQASSTAMPAYTPSDAHDLHVALTAVDRQLRAIYPHRLGARALLGYSMGGFHTLFISTANPDQNQGLIPFDRYVAIDTPVRLLYGISKLDEFYQAPAQWPAEERTARIRNTFLKVAAVARDTEMVKTNAPPFSAVESKFIIGLAFRFILRDAIYTSQKVNNMHVLQQPLAKDRRAQVYQEILGFSYGEYFERFVIPYYKNRGIDLSSQEAQAKASDLRAYQATLQANKNVRLIVNRNDILLAPTDLAWLQSTFSPDRLTVFDQGGHLGNLGHPAVQKTILSNLEDLKAPRP
jgi:pimeloyl-ACP methyl ester carboxylesterase